LARCHPLQLIDMGVSALQHHLSLHDKLSDRKGESEYYRSLLEEVLGISLQRAVISTSEHAAPFNLAHSVSYALPQLAIQGAKLRSPARVVILVASLVPFDNRHHPRGFLTEDGGRFHLFSKRLEKTCSYLQGPVDVSSRKDGAAFFSRFPWLQPLLTRSPRFSDAAQQLSAIMETMVSRWSPLGAGGQVTIQPFEEVARGMLIRLLEANDPWLCRLFFDANIRRAIAVSLSGTFCAWGEHHGSFLFWHCSGKKPRRLVEENGSLINADIAIPITRDSLLNALTTRTIVPGVFLALMVISYLPGLAVAGGPKQPAYYRTMIRAANGVDANITRSEDMSTYGYWCVDMTLVSPNADSGGNIPAIGAGLWLTEKSCDASWICDQLDRCPVLPIPEAVSYD
jgi:hypothetical protein